MVFSLARQMYIQPLREATTLGEDYSRSDETAIFSTIEMIWYQHIDLLTEMQAMMDQWSTDRNMGILILGRLCVRCRPCPSCVRVCVHGAV